MTDEGDFDDKQLRAPAKALVRGQWGKAASGLVSAATTAASGNPFAGIAAAGAAEWLWAKAAAQTATAKLEAMEAELEKLDEEARVAFVQRCLGEGFTSATVRDATPGSGELSEIEDILEEGLGQVLLGIARLQQGQGEIKDAIAKLDRQVGAREVGHERNRWRQLPEDSQKAMPASILSRSDLEELSRNSVDPEPLGTVTVAALMRDRHRSDHELRDKIIRRNREGRPTWSLRNEYDRRLRELGL